MSPDVSNWIVERGGDIGELKAERGVDALSPVESLIYSLWIIDYCMCNAGDLANLNEMYPDCLVQSSEMAAKSGFPKTASLFSHTPENLARRYFNDLEIVVAELQAVYGKMN